ncbi:hypothetical protein C8Q74DRAFT_1367133 [Fomes fomentarius]|nr:hypothetical protein C8Q74DRAFT_1367133 [Fomes fomentarius]
MVTFALGCGFAQRARALHVPGRLLTVFANIPYEITLDILRACRSGPPWQSQLHETRVRFLFLAGLSSLCAIGSFFSTDPDIPYALADKWVDWLGVLLVIAGLLTYVVFVLSNGSRRPMGGRPAVNIIARLMISVFLVVLFLLWEHFLENVHSSPDPDTVSRQQ